MIRVLMVAMLVATFAVLIGVGLLSSGALPSVPLSLAADPSIIMPTDIIRLGCNGGCK